MAGVTDREGLVAGFGRLFVELMANVSSGGTKGERVNCDKNFQCRNT